MNDDVLAYLLSRQQDEHLTSAAMAVHLGLSETAWCHIRKGRRRLTVAQIERAMELYPEIHGLIAPKVLAS